MVFSSYIFLFGFLPLFLLCYFSVPRGLRNPVALAGSYLFYGWGAPQVLPILLASSFADYYITRLAARRPGRAKRYIAGGVILNAALLAYFKYANFFLHEMNRVLGAIGASAIGWEEVLLPIGISFFTFQKISYLVDVYRGTAAPARSFVEYALYVALFPQLIAGPIVRYHDVALQLRSRSIDAAGFYCGTLRFCTGLGKKVLIADPLGAVADNVFGLRTSALPIDYAWLGITCYAFQIYFDFSGYSDMAIGLGRMLGFRFLENFDMPYIARNFTEFWRRWHISLSNWMREYLYVPLGGNRVSSARRYINLWIVFLISGLWHGASWNFVAWGAYHGMFLSADKLFWLRLQRRLPDPLNVALTFVLVLIGWVFFRAETLSGAVEYLTAMFDVSSIGVKGTHLVRADIINNRAAVTLVVAAALSFLPAGAWYERARERLRSRGSVWRDGLVGAGALAVLLLAAVALAGVDFAPFLYFRF